MAAGTRDHGVVVLLDRLGFDPCAGLQLADWLLTPTQRLASVTAGEVFHDPESWLSHRRRALSWYPDDVWRYVLAAGWLRIGQEQAFVGRAGAAGDELGSRVVAGRLARDLVRIAFLLERRWAPYGKWLGRAFADLHLARTIGSHLDVLLAAPEWRSREAALCAAASALAEATNAVGLAAPVDPTARGFLGRDIRVVDAEGLTTALCARITDAEIITLLHRLGRRDGGEAPRLPGSIDQAVDSADILTDPQRCRAAAPVLGLLPDAVS